MQSIHTFLTLVSAEFCCSFGEIWPLFLTSTFPLLTWPFNFPSTWVLWKPPPQTLNLPICPLGPPHTACQNDWASNYLTQFTALHEFTPLAVSPSLPLWNFEPAMLSCLHPHTPPIAKSPPRCSLFLKFSSLLTSGQGLPPSRLAPLRWGYAFAHGQASACRILSHSDKDDFILQDPI